MPATTHKLFEFLDGLGIATTTALFTVSES